MSYVITVTDVQHWAACKRVYLRPDTVLTAEARRWLAERGVEVQVDADSVHEQGPQETTSIQSPGESVLEVQLLRWIPRVVAELGGSVSQERVHDAVRKLLGESESSAENINNTPSSMPALVQRAIITVLGKDRVGIISRITSLLSGKQANVLDINQTLFGDLFSMNMSVDISAAVVSFAELKDALEKAGEEMQLKVLVQREAVFDYMHRV